MSCIQQKQRERCRSNIFGGGCKCTGTDFHHVSCCHGTRGEFICQLIMYFMCYSLLKDAYTSCRSSMTAYSNQSRCSYVLWLLWHTSTFVKSKNVHCETYFSALHSADRLQDRFCCVTISHDCLEDHLMQTDDKNECFPINPSPVKSDIPQKR